MKAKGNKILNILTIITSVILAIGLIILGVQVFTSSNEKNKFTENVVISGVNVKGLNKEQAENKVNNNLKNKIDNLKLKLTYKDKVWEYTSEDFVVSTNIHTIIEDNVNNTLYNLVEEVEKIKDSKNYDLIKNIDELFNEISDIDLKNKLNDLFQINKFNVLNIDKILNLESDTKKLYHFFTSIEFKKSIADNIELSKKMSENILPNLQKLINKNKEIER